MVTVYSDDLEESVRETYRALGSMREHMHNLAQHEWQKNFRIAALGGEWATVRLKREGVADFKAEAINQELRDWLKARGLAVSKKARVSKWGVCAHAFVRVWAARVYSEMAGLDGDYREMVEDDVAMLEQQCPAGAAGAWQQWVPRFCTPRAKYSDVSMVLIDGSYPWFLSMVLIGGS